MLKMVNNGFSFRHVTVKVTVNGDLTVKQMVNYGFYFRYIIIRVTEKKNITVKTLINGK